jgi:hypothetical protein
MTLYAGSCQLWMTFVFNGPIGFGTFTNPGYTLYVQPMIPCQLTENGLEPFRHTIVDASGSSSIFDCNTAVASGSWNQWWQDPRGAYTPPPVTGGSHRVYGTFDNWVMELEGPELINFAGAIQLRLDPTYAAYTTNHCAGGSLWELHTIGQQVFEDPILLEK